MVTAKTIGILLLPASFFSARVCGATVGSWIAGVQGQSCDETCGDQICNVDQIATIDSQEKMNQLANSLGVNCQFYSAANWDTIPLLNNNNGYCFYWGGGTVNPNCSGSSGPDTRMCFCGPSPPPILDYTITTPNYSVTSSEVVLTFVGNYVIHKTYDQADTTYQYSQSFVTVANGACTAVEVTVGTTLLAAGQSGTTLDATFALDLETAPPAVFTVDGATGTVSLCHRIQVRNGAVLMNQVDTMVTATVDLTADISVVISTTKSESLSSTVEGNVDLGATVSAVASPTSLSAGEPLTVTLTSPLNKFTIATAILDGESALASNTKFLSTTNTCEAEAATECKIEITLGFEYFREGATLSLTGTVLFELGSGRRLENDADTAPFEVSFRTLKYAQSGSTLLATTSGLIAISAMALV